MHVGARALVSCAEGLRFGSTRCLDRMFTNCSLSSKWVPGGNIEEI